MKIWLLCLSILFPFYVTGTELSFVSIFVHPVFLQKRCAQQMRAAEKFECSIWTILWIMCWIKYVICFVPEFSAARICRLSLDKRIIHSSRSVVMKRTDRRAIGTECLRRRSRYLHGTACSALPDETRVNVTAVPRPNMSTAALERRPGQRAQGSIPISHI